MICECARSYKFYPKLRLASGFTLIKSTKTVTLQDAQVPLHSIFEGKTETGGLTILNQSQNFKNATFLPKLYIKKLEISYIFQFFKCAYTILNNSGNINH